jgi:hypothetical protein
MWLLFTSTMAGACDLQGVDELVARAEAAFQSHDDAALRDAVDAVDRELRCLKVVMPPRWCARVHYAHALLAWADGSPAECVAALRAATHAEPMFRLPEEVVPRTHAMTRLAWQAEEAPDRWTATPRPLLVDGLPSAAVPIDQPWIGQKSLGAGTARGAKWNEVRVGMDGGPIDGQGHTKRNLRWVGVGTGAVGFGLLTAAAVERSQYQDALATWEDTGAAGDYARLQPLHTRTNVLSTAWAVTGVAAAGLVTVSFVVP